MWCQPEAHDPYLWEQMAVCGNHSKHCDMKRDSNLEIWQQGMQHLQQSDEAWTEARESF